MVGGELVDQAELLLRLVHLALLQEDLDDGEMGGEIVALDFDGLEELSPLYVNVVNQLLAYYMAKFKGTDIDKPRNLAKSVTVE